MFAVANRSEQGNNTSYLCNVLIALGKAERTLAKGLRFANDKYIRPLQGLSVQWLDLADDGKSPEFRLAVAAAGISGERDRIGPFRAFLEEVEFKGRYARWSAGSASAVWSNAPLAVNLASVFRRRQIEAFRDGFNGVPLSSPRPASLADVLAFVKNEVDEDKLTALIWAMPALDWGKIQFKLPPATDRDWLELPFEFGVARMLVEPLPLVADEGRWQFGETRDPTTPDPEIFHLLSCGQRNAIQLSVDCAARRLKSGGRLVNGYRNRRHAGKSLNASSPVDPERLLGAMLFPLSSHDLGLIANAVLYPPET